MNSKHLVLHQERGQYFVPETGLQYQGTENSPSLTHGNKTQFMQCLFLDGRIWFYHEMANSATTYWYQKLGAINLWECQ